MSVNKKHRINCLCQVVCKNWSYQLLIQLMFSSQHPYLMCIGQWKQTTYVSFEILKPSKMCQSSCSEYLLRRYNSQQNIRWNIWNPKSWSWMVQMMFLFIIFGGWFSGWSSHQFVWGSEMIFPHKNQPKRTYPPKDLANSRPTMVWYGTPINRRKYVGFHWDRNNWRYNHYKWPYKWGSLGL